MNKTQALQYAALPYRRNDEDKLEIMLITSRDTGRWIIPKGWPIPNLGPADAAAREAYEEAGLIGRIGDQPIGRYFYDKRLDDGSKVHCAVVVFTLEVEKQRKSWPERDERRTRWFIGEEAVVAVDEPELRAIIERLAGSGRFRSSSD
ncbi:MAG: NUDIX hydrolase [Xanthobacteraceae bacterium]